MVRFNCFDGFNGGGGLVYPDSVVLVCWRSFVGAGLSV